MDNIEEVKKIQGWIDNRMGVPNTFNIQLLTDFLAFIRSQLLPQPLDDKKLREKIGKIVSNAITADMVDGRYGSKPYTDQILALLQPKIEEAKREERERILDAIDELSNDGEFFLTPQEIRQALKGEGNG